MNITAKISPRTLNYILLSIICLLSLSAFLYLNSIKTASATLAGQQKNLPNANQKNSDKSIKPQDAADKDSNQYNSKEVMPDVQLLNFVIRKGREGIPVLFARYIF
jgi:hypothetical protein